MASSQANMDKMQVRQNYRNLWHSALMGTMQADTRCISLSLSLSSILHLIISVSDMLWTFVADCCFAVFWCVPLICFDYLLFIQFFASLALRSELAFDFTIPLRILCCLSSSLYLRWLNCTFVDLEILSPCFPPSVRICTIWVLKF